MTKASTRAGKPLRTRSFKKNAKSWTWLLPMILPLIAQAQAVPGIGDVLKQVPFNPPVQQPRAPLPEVGGSRIEPPMQRLPLNGPTVTVSRFDMVGNREIGKDMLLAQIADQLGKPLTLAQLEETATRLTRFYRAKGYFVARVYVPAQEVKDGIVILRAVEGNYGRFVLDNKSRVRDSIVQGMLDDVKKYDIVSLDTLERAMLIVNDTPGAQVVRADVMPGEAVGTSDFAVGTVATAPVDGYVAADNYGSRYTGRNRVSFNVDWNSPTGSGDRLSASGLGSTSGELVNGRLAYSLPLAPSGWRGEVAVSQTHYALGDRYDALDAQGRARTVEASVTYPIRRIRAQTIEAGLTLAHNDLNDEIRSMATSTPKTSDTLNASLSLRDEGALFGLDGQTQASVGLMAGRLHIRDDSALALDQAAGGADTQGAFNKVSIGLSRLSVLPHNFSLTGSLRLQWTPGRNLDGSERMGVSGVGGVMAYPSGELSGGDAALAHIELGQALPAWMGLQQQWNVFSDWAQARPTSMEETRSLSDVGLGWSARHSKGLMVKAAVAHRLSDAAQSEPANKNRLLIQVGWMF